jgi:hypothetical protein
MAALQTLQLAFGRAMPGEDLVFIPELKYPDLP